MVLEKTSNFLDVVVFEYVVYLFPLFWLIPSFQRLDPMLHGLGDIEMDTTRGHVMNS